MLFILEAFDIGIGCPRCLKLYRYLHLALFLDMLPVLVGYLFVFHFLALVLGLFWFRFFILKALLENEM